MQQDAQSLPLPRVTVAPLPEQPVAILARLWDEAERSIVIRRTAPKPASDQTVAAEKSSTARYAYD